YTLVFEVADACGNVAQSVEHVLVPHPLPASAHAANGFTANGKEIAAGATRVAVVVLGGAGDADVTDVVETGSATPRDGAETAGRGGFTPLMVGDIDVERLRIGNTGGIARPIASQILDANHDGEADLVLWFSSAALQTIRRADPDAIG